MAMWRIKSCPKCGGDVYLDVEGNIWFDHCLQCGYMQPRTGITCPYCGLEMVIEEQEGDKFYYCGNCGYKSALHQVSS